MVQKITYNNDFVQAIFYLSDPILGHDVYDWFLGKKLSDNTLRRLGIKYCINNIEIAQVSLNFWMTIFGEIQRPLLLYVDDIEFLLTDTNDEVKSVNIGILKSLTECFISNNCFLCFSVVTNNWPTLFIKLKNRIHCIQIFNLALDEVINLIKMFIDSSNKLEISTSYKQIYPYTQEAILKMLLHTNGNISEVLHLAYETFKETELNDTNISEARVEDVAISLNKYFDHHLIIEEIVKLLQDNYFQFTIKNLTFIKDRETNTDITITHSEESFALIRIISTSIVDEKDIVNLLKQTNKFNQKHPETKLILVFCGYISTKIYTKMAKNIHIDHYLIHNSEKLKTQCSEIILFLKTLRKEAINFFEANKFNREIKDLLIQIRSLIRDIDHNWEKQKTETRNQKILTDRIQQVDDAVKNLSYFFYKTQKPKVIPGIKKTKTLSLLEESESVKQKQDDLGINCCLRYRRNN